MTVVASLLCFSRTLSNRCVNNDRIPGTSFSNNLCTSLLRAMLLWKVVGATTKAA